ncbi:uncharacterized protein F4822DRAFT_115725 [Hypoxylon trugodes]|uniref:uncharacterized protein n=1 Tax=Hypoxylon trugodes TaxID=326681 RepID=UPI00218FF6B2|nr:uncharacterized protein F4822DRAFT_115725 [Hypoxylon trugodes]KAI1392114.1 hypothetical protein F4822DRAFT_115725 [Hypoxylon trugodes]
MYRRNSTKTRHLDRHKSTSSAKSVHLEHIHPETAERDAQAAAAQAFAMAKERSAAEGTLWPPPRNNDLSGTGVSNGTPSRCNNHPALRRQQSVRFVRGGVLQSTPKHMVVEDATLACNVGTTTPKVSISSIESRPTSNASASGMAFAAKGAAGDYINALFTGEEYYTPEDDIASAPSSYRKIRKSRSMFTTSEASMTSRDYAQAPASSTMDQLPMPSTNSPQSVTVNTTPAAGLKAPKSMSFLRGRREQSLLFSKRRGSVPIRLSSGEGTGTTNNKEKPIKSQPSTFLRPNADKILRRSMRDSSNDTLHLDIKVPKNGSLRNRARKVSLNFKHKLKNLFGLGKGDTDEEAFPPQQIEASKSHITDLDVPDYMNDDGLRLEPMYDQAALSRVTSGIPSLHAVPSHQQLRSRQGSLESLRSDYRTSDERSRVTSWSNSDTNTINTLNSRKGEWDRQRLSVIKEHGMHISSSSARPHDITARAMNINTSACSLPPPKPPQPATVNSQRIYSALMKRLNETNKELQRQRSVDDFINTGTVPTRGSSRNHRGRGPNSPATIRHVIPDEVSDSSSVRTTERKPATRFRGVRSPSGSNVELVSEGRGIATSVSAPTVNGSGEPADEGNKLSSTPRVEEPIPSARTLSTRSSAFFASPTCHLFRTQSPYRRALQDSMKAESQDTRLRSPKYNPWMRSLTNLPIRCPSTCESEVDKKMHYAESIYSSTTEEPFNGFSIDASVTVDNFPKPPSVHGDATIFVTPPVYRPTPPPIPIQRVTSTTSSVEWKTWLSANVSKLEGTSAHADTGILEYTIPSTRPSGHVREKAQINDDDEQPIEVYKPTRPDSALATIEHNTRGSPNILRPVLKTSSPAPPRDKENEVPERPEVSPGGVLRATPSLSSMKSFQEAKASTEPTKKGVFDSIGRKSQINKPSLNTLGGNPTSTRKLVRKQPGLRNYVTPTSSPGPKAVADKQSARAGGSASSGYKFGAGASQKTENVSPIIGLDADRDPYDTQGSGILGPESALTSQSMGSKRMVDLFLSSRRRRIASGEDGGVFM